MSMFVFVVLEKPIRREVKQFVDIGKNMDNEGTKITQIQICDDGPGFPDDIKKFLGEPYIHSKDKEI